MVLDEDCLTKDDYSGDKQKKHSQKALQLSLSKSHTNNVSTFTDICDAEGLTKDQKRDNTNILRRKLRGLKTMEKKPPTNKVTQIFE
jgi:hypothetical protein